MSLKRLKGVRVPHNKNTAQMAAQPLPVPGKVTIPLSMNIGAPSKPIVKPGEHVDVGQLIAEAGGYVGAPVHASVSGTVKKIVDIMQANGRVAQGVLIESDGLMTVSDTVKPPVVTDSAGFFDAVRASGVVGLGGAAFPTAVKLAVKDLSAVKEVLVNGAECEPYITSDTRTMIDDAEYVVKGCRLLEEYMGVKKIMIGIEANKPKAIAAMEKASAEDECISVHKLPSVYPQGGEKVLIYNLTGKIVPEGKLPLDVGCIVINCTTLAFIAKYIETGMPLVKKCVTVDGSAVEKPQNLLVPVGTHIQDILNYVGLKAEPKKILLGGPMMGMAAFDIEAPIVKGTNALLAFAEADSLLPESTACIRCGKCVDVCPMNLMPAEIERAYEKRDGQELNKLKVNLCMECGCCAFGCPARRPLVQTHKLAKIVQRDWLNRQKALEEKKKAEKEEAEKAKEVAVK